MAFWIKGGCLVNTLLNIVEEKDLIIEGDKIKSVMPWNAFKDNGPGIETIDAAGRIIIPGMIDMHVHLREPGYEYKETIETGARAGVASGFTALACMSNTKPVNDNPSVTEFILEQAEKANLLRVYPIAAITKEQKGESFTDFKALCEAGAIGVSDDGFPIRDKETMKKAMEQAHLNKMVIISHCEDLELSKDGVVHEGEVSKKLGLRGIPSKSEVDIVKREISLSRQTNCPVHIAHVSCIGSVEAIRRAKEANIPVTAETAPHYFTLDHRAVIDYNTNAKMNPPLRSPEDVEAIREGLRDGSIDVIATDHAPHSRDEKKQDFKTAPFGIIGLETALPLVLDMVGKEVLSLPDAIGKVTREPARILGVEGGILREGSRADLAIIDTDCEYELKEDGLYSKSANTPFLGRTLKGCNMLTMVAGQIKWAKNA